MKPDKSLTMEEFLKCKEAFEKNINHWLPTAEFSYDQKLWIIAFEQAKMLFSKGGNE